MPDLLTIQPVAATQAAGAAQGAAQSAAAPADTGSAAKTALPDLPNPSMHLDPQLGMVVLEFHNTSGQVTNTLPTQQQLDAYRAFGVPKPGDDAKARTLA